MNFQEENAMDVAVKIEQSLCAILPIGAVEAHGPHLPLGTDNLLAERLARLLADRTNSFVLPTLPYGQVWSLQNFPGSINVSNEALIRMLYDIGESLVRQGFRIFAMLNGHLGNAPALKDAARLLYRDYPELKVYYFFYPGSKETIAKVRETPSSHASYFHACELETSYMLYLAEEHVDMSRAVNDPPTIDLEADCTPTPWETFTSTAVLGDATLATKEKGQQIIESTLQTMTAIIANAKQRILSEREP
ncbi:creatininase family protein [Paenibacillus thiaminolyticus]|uniref:creatininase family protein n=1 Tax=Paenibacillus thiaminolyticus TaxID=49283 RepID=UPI001163D53A|nr:creatininase family protein [Paenibacillus thiaminolyticus]NGP58460.1 creatininase family protein [Paenibacillus thiaminolyticus]WCR26491.1 creatininase family protein [Paenibacillus thiaminolyticus]